MATRIPIWLDCDTGHDDAYAILLAAHHPQVRLLGISTVYGNAPLSHTTHNTRAILKAIGREDIPVYEGAAKPFCRPAAAAPDIHGDTGLDGTTCLPSPTVPKRTDKTVIQAIYEALIAEPAGTAWVVPTGCLTNIALLFATCPDLEEHIAGLSIMGGAVGGGFSDAPVGKLHGEGDRFGNWTPWAEFNIYLDPESAAAVFHSPVLASKTTLITLDLTHQFLGTKDIQEGLLQGFIRNGTEIRSSTPPSKVRKLFVEILVFFAKTYAEVFGLVQGPPLHDPLAVAAAFVPHLFQDNNGERFDIRVVTEGDHGASSHVRSGESQCGRTIVNPVPHGNSGVRIPRGLDKLAIWQLLDGCLDVAEKSSQAFS
ncbi:Inosine/uridine-preferring nucleoside hydrolase [Polychaeton citri CBS 116435]|uniref:Inosine/uridine-preferring nucleoside hydrolase n=1 Tax=Polychaeton citri CBS 116435 TaxID=1314669 RepID=A0A9P4UJS6_9PEZI|nr:Inosine/uridine-preferring nucleoside hydrolase [Polychaeton citri CBS 116435]